MSEWERGYAAGHADAERDAAGKLDPGQVSAAMSYASEMYRDGYATAQAEAQF